MREPHALPYVTRCARCGGDHWTWAGFLACIKRFRDGRSNGKNA